MRKYLILLAGLALLSTNSNAQNALYLAADGTGISFSKQAPGNINDLESKLKQVNPDGGALAIYLKQGFYYLKKPLIINHKSIGGKYSKLLITGETGARPTISGGRRLTGWTLWKNGIYKEQVPDELDSRQLYVNSNLAIRARTPNQTDANDYGPYFRIKNFGTVNKSITVNASELGNIQNSSNVEMVINQHWYQSRLLIDSIKHSDEDIHIIAREPVRNQLFSMHAARDIIAAGRTYYFENALEFLDDDNEWYLDKNTHTIYYKPPAGQNINDLDIEIPVLTTVLNVSGVSNNPVENVEINSLNITCSKWLFPGQSGLIMSVSVNMEFTTRKVATPGIIGVDYANNILIRDCNIFDSGGNGVLFGKGVKKSRLDNNHFYNICANAIAIDPYTFRSGNLIDSLKCSSDTISHNLIENFGTNYTTGSGIFASCVSNLLIEKNEIRYGRYIGIQVGNLFGDVRAGVDNNIIRENNIHDVMYLHDDGGAIYVLGNQPGTKIYNNYIHDISKGKWADSFPIAAIYLDASSAFMSLENNSLSNLKNTLKLKLQVGEKTKAHDNDVQHFEIKGKPGIPGN